MGNGNRIADADRFFVPATKLRPLKKRVGTEDVKSTGETGLDTVTGDRNGSNWFN